MKESCRSCTRIIDSNDLTAGGLFGTCAQCLREKQTTRLHLSNLPTRAELPPLNPGNSISALLTPTSVEQRRGLEVANLVSPEDPVIRDPVAYIALLRKKSDELAEREQVGKRWVPSLPSPLGADEDFYLSVEPCEDCGAKSRHEVGCPTAVTNLEDIEYFRQKLIAALKIFPAYMSDFLDKTRNRPNSG